MDMETIIEKAIEEMPIISEHSPLKGEGVDIFIDDVKNSEIGTSWFFEEQDKNPDPVARWKNEYRLIYKGRYCAIIRHTNYIGYVGPTVGKMLETSLITVKFAVRGD